MYRRKLVELHEATFQKSEKETPMYEPFSLAKCNLHPSRTLGRISKKFSPQWHRIVSTRLNTIVRDKQIFKNKTQKLQTVFE